MNNNNISFEEVVKSIKECEKRVDEVLDAARLERNKRPPMSDERFDRIMDLVGTTIFELIILTGVLTFFYLMAH